MSFRLFVLLLFPLVFMNLLVVSCSGYVVRAGWGQAELLFSRQPVQKVLADPDTDSALREKLLLTRDILDFVRVNLHLKPGSTYTSYVELDRDALAWNVTASRPLALEARTWWFPVVGEVPYLGFFSRQRAKEHAEKLRAQGYDVRIRTVAGYSTLGWFNDPLYSTQVKSSDLDLIRLIIHESAHRTVWFDNDVGFNESFATFVEKAGSRAYVVSRYGFDSGLLQKLENEYAREEEIRLLFFRYAQKLSELYDSPVRDAQKMRRKEEILEEFAVEFSTLFEGELSEKIRKKKYNNADFLSVKRYNSGGEFFDEIFYLSSEGRWAEFIQRIQSLKKLEPEDRKELLQRTDHPE